MSQFALQIPTQTIKPCSITKLYQMCLKKPIIILGRMLPPPKFTQHVSQPGNHLAKKSR